MAIVLREGDRATFLDSMVENDAIMSAGTLIETLMVSHGRGGKIVTEDVRVLVDRLGIQIVSVEPEHVAIAQEAFMKYGKGNGHPAQLNFGDLFSYALAKERNLPLLFKGNDFAATDITSASATL